jgi:two-component system, response regulator PdtaR
MRGMTATKRAQPYQILISDDDRESRETLRDIVEAEGYPTVLAENGEEAVDLVREVPVHLALLDLHMPRLTGLEAIQLARQFKAGLPFILVTADPDSQVMRLAVQLQVFSVLPKPVNRNVVVYTIVRALGRVYGEAGGEQI